MSVQLRNVVLAVVIILLVILVLIPQFRKGPVEFEAVPQYEHQNGNIYVPETSPIRDRLVVSEATVEPVRKVVSAPASVEANPSKRANIFPPVGGRIVRLFVSMGENVSRNQALFEIFSPDIAEIQTEYISARSELAQAEKELRRKEVLHERGIVPQRELEEAQTGFDIAKSEMEGATLKMEIFGIDLDNPGRPLIVRSPINGRVIDLMVAAGEYIGEPEEPLMIIADLSSVWVTASIQEKDIRFVERGGEVIARFPAYPGDVYEGEVLFVGDILDEETRTTKVRVAFENEDNRLKPGMFASVKFKSRTDSLVVLPAKAVLQRRDFNYVYVEKEPFLFASRQVITGDEEDGIISILSGLEAGERVIVENAVLLP